MSNTRNAGRKPKITSEQLQEIKSRRQAGESVATLAEEYGVSRQALNKRLVEERNNKETRIDYMIDDQLCTSIYIDKKSAAIRLINYTQSLSKRAFGFNESPGWQELIDFLEEYYLREKGVTNYKQLLCLDDNDQLKFIIDHQKDNTDDLQTDKSERLVINQGKWIPKFQFTKTDRIITRTDTDGYQMKAITADRRFFVKSQAIMSGVLLNDWAVELIACDICKQLDISCVQQQQCEFVYEGRAFKGVYSPNFELDGFTFISFERLLERQGKSSKEEEFISLNAIEKLKWCADNLAVAGNLDYEDTLKYMLDLAVLDCLIGNIDRHTRNFGLFYNAQTGKYQIPLIFDNGMGLFENDYYRDNYKSFEDAMNTVYASPYGEDPFALMEMLDKEFDLKKIYPGLKILQYGNQLSTDFALEYERRMMDLWRK